MKRGEREAAEKEVAEEESKAAETERAAEELEAATAAAEKFLAQVDSFSDPNHDSSLTKKSKIAICDSICVS